MRTQTLTTRGKESRSPSSPLFVSMSTDKLGGLPLCKLSNSHDVFALVIGSMCFLMLSPRKRHRFVRLGKVTALRLCLFFYSDHFMYHLNRRMGYIQSLGKLVLPADPDSPFYTSDLETVKLSHLAKLLSQGERAMLKTLNPSHLLG